MTACAIRRRRHGCGATSLRVLLVLLVLLALNSAAVPAIGAFVAPSLYCERTATIPRCSPSLGASFSLDYRASRRLRRALAVVAFAPPAPTTTALRATTNDGSDDDVRTSTAEPSAGESSSAPPAARCWNPDLRKLLGGIASLGLLETSYLTYAKIYGTGSTLASFCSNTGNGASSCADVLNSPYGSLTMGGVDVPLSALGMMAYGAVLSLAVGPLLLFQKPLQQQDNDDLREVDNRIALLGVTTLMASFSVYLMALLFVVLRASCPFCIVSASFSVTLAGLSWTGGVMPSNVELKQRGFGVGAASVGAATVAALLLFLTASPEADVGGRDFLALSDAVGASSTLLVSADVNDAAGGKYAKNVAPPITTTSTPRALAVAVSLSNLNSRFFGAYWCSHCYEQKQTLGLEAMRSYVPYVECDKEGYQNQRALCKAKDIPGYPTWEIGGKLFPGEQSLEELEETVRNVQQAEK